MILFKVHKNWVWSFVWNVRCLIGKVIILFLVFHCLFICQSKWWQMVLAELMSRIASKRVVSKTAKDRGMMLKKEKVTLHSHNCFFPRLNRRPNSSRTRYCGSKPRGQVIFCQQYLNEPKETLWCFRFYHLLFYKFLSF